MILLVAPYALVPIIGQNPNSTLSVAMTFVPLLNSFVVHARLASGTPPPLWQVFGAMATGLVGAGVAVWFAAKVFKIGLLMQGKPPSFGTLGEVGADGLGGATATVSGIVTAVPWGAVAWKFAAL